MNTQKQSPLLWARWRPESAAEGGARGIFPIMLQTEPFFINTVAKQTITQTHKQTHHIFKINTHIVFDFCFVILCFFIDSGSYVLPPMHKSVFL